VRSSAGVAASAAALLVLGTGAASADAGSGLLRIVQDDALLVHGAPAPRAAALDELARLGVDVIRVNLPWRELAPRRRPRAEDAGATPAAWAPYDALVLDAHARGLRVLMTPTTPAPDWAASALDRRRRGVVRPDPAAFAAWVAAAGARYGGAAGAPARVDLWGLVNEPNSPNQLAPQRDRLALRSPAAYRRLLRAGLTALARTGHPAREIVAGDLLAVGGADPIAAAPQAPLSFLRELLCLDRRDRPLARSPDPAHPGCAGRVPPLAVRGVSVHPYYAPGLGPAARPRRADQVTPGTLGRLRKVLLAARRAGRLVGPAQVWDTEGGVQTDPPDPLAGTSPARQARFVNEAEWLADRTPGVRSFAQYPWRDEPALPSFQSGLRFADGRAKPALAAYALPLVARRVTPRRARLWTRLPSGAGAAAVLVDGARRAKIVRPSGATTYATATIAVPRATVRLRLAAGGRRSRGVVLRRADGAPVER